MLSLLLSVYLFIFLHVQSTHSSSDTPETGSRDRPNDQPSVDASRTNFRNVLTSDASFVRTYRRDRVLVNRQ
jgi:hypothetical protein